MQTDLMTRLNNGDLLILDGGTGTEMERVGAPMHSGVWCAAATETHPHLVKEVHKHYIAAGADIITTNTYASGRQSLAKSGLEDKFELLNNRAIALAHEARTEAIAEMAIERPIYIAGSIAPFDHWGKEYDATALRLAYREQAQLHAASNVDLILLEMLAADLDTTLVAIEEAKQTALPVWVSISCLDNLETGELYFGAREELDESKEEHFRYDLGLFSDAVAKIVAAGVDVLSMMHSEIRVTVPALEIIRQQWSGPMGVYPNSGHWVRPNWDFKADVSAEFYAAEAQKWIAAGANIVGGCCGVGREHIEAVSQTLRA